MQIFYILVSKVTILFRRLHPACTKHSDLCIKFSKIFIFFTDIFLVFHFVPKPVSNL